MGSVIPLKKSANSAYLELKNLIGFKLQKVENLIEQKLKSDVDQTPLPLKDLFLFVREWTAY